MAPAYRETLPSRLKKTIAPPSVEGIVEECRLTLEAILDTCQGTGLGHSEKVAEIQRLAEEGVRE